MNYLLLKGYECLTVVLPFLITFVILCLYYRYKNVPYTKGRFLMLVVFITYIFTVIYFTSMGTMFDLLQYGLQLRADQINLLPFSRVIDKTAYFLNIVLFLPFGFLLPFIWPRADKLICTVISGLSFSLLVELSQLLNYRSTDIDDLIMNTLGTLAGYLLLRVFKSLTGRTTRPITYIKYEPAIYILAAFLGHFLMYNEFGLVKILYGIKIELL